MKQKIMSVFHIWEGKHRGRISFIKRQTLIQLTAFAACFLIIFLSSGCLIPEPFEPPAPEPTPIRTTIELGDVIGPDDHRYVCYEDIRGNTVSHSFDIPSNVIKILSGTIYVRYTNNDPEGYLRACGLRINDEPSFCSDAIGCYRIAKFQVRGFTAGSGQTVESTFNIQDVMYPVNYPETGSVQVDLSQFLNIGENLLTTRVSYGTGEGSPITVRIVLEVELAPIPATIELGDVVGPDNQRYICYEDKRGNTIAHSFNMPAIAGKILSGTVYVRYTNNDPEGYLRACDLTINNEPSHCSHAIGCYRIAQYQVRGFTASRGQTVESTFDIKDVMFPVNYPETGSVQVDLSQYLQPGINSLITRVSYGTGEGSPITVRIVLEVENY